MWTKITRPKYQRAAQRYASDLTDAEWAVIEPHRPATKHLGRPRGTDLRAVLDGILYIARTGCQWRMLPKDFPPFTTVQGYFDDWRDSGLFERINFELLLEAREAAGREASPSANVIDSQSVKTTESGGPRGGACPRARHRRDPGDAAKEVKGRKRHIVTDTTGLMLGAAIHPADVIYINAGATRPAPFWLDGLKEGGRLILPLTTYHGCRSSERRQIHPRGAVFRIEQRGSEFLARWLLGVVTFPCEGARDAASELALSAAFATERWREVTRLYRRDDLPADQCWLRAPGWCLAYR